MYSRRNYVNAERCKVIITWAEDDDVEEAGRRQTSQSKQKNFLSVLQSWAAHWVRQVKDEHSFKVTFNVRRWFKLRVERQHARLWHNAHISVEKNPVFKSNPVTQRFCWLFSLTLFFKKAQLDGVWGLSDIRMSTAGYYPLQINMQKFANR